MSDVLQMPMRVSVANVEQDEAQATLDMINRHAMQPFRSLDNVFVFEGNCSNNLLDAYHTKMDPHTTLNNYANDLDRGVSLMNGHDITQIPYGRSFKGVVIPEQEVTSVRGSWYVPKGLEINGSNTDHLIRAITTGVQRDMSVGFTDSEYRCSSCGRDLFDYRCDHFPGLEDENGNRTFAWIMNARLREVSTVYKGATPNATISAYVDKARSYYDQGELDQSYIMKLENAYSIRLDDGTKHSFYVPSKRLKGEENIDEPKEDKTMGAQARNSLLDDIRSAIRENKVEKAVIYDILGEEGDPFRQPEDIELRNELGKEFCKIEAIRQLKKEAQQGRRYLSDVIDQAVSSRVKAQGDSFNADSYRQMLTLSGDIDHIKDEIDSYERLAKQRFVGGRQTEDDQLPNDDDDNRSDDSFKLDPNADNFFEEGEE